MIMASSKIFLLFFIMFLFSPTQAQLVYLYHKCSYDKTFTANSAFQSHLTTLLSSLASVNTHFYNATAVSGGGDTVYGLFICQGDITLQLCHQCVVQASQRLLLSECRVSKEAIIWYSQCMVRYSNRSFFSTLETRPRLSILNAGDETWKVSLQLLLDTLNFAAGEAAVDAKKYATRNASISEFRTIYSLLQCTPDLSSQDCRKCMSAGISYLSRCCVGQGGRVVSPSCNVRYETYPFYHTDDDRSEATMTTPTALSPPTNSSHLQVKGKDQSKRTIGVLVVSYAGGLGIFFGLAYYLLKSLIKKRRNAVLRQKYFGNESNNLEPLQFSLATIEAATNKFSHENCLGRGGFGQVYKGILSNGQKIAVKRLSKSSGQGTEEFKNEVLLIARLQHRNLVALLGFCIEEQEKILIYEYVPNKSLDYFLSGSQNGKALNWVERYNIIGGVAQGILYLHEYSHFKIIHRDLKPSNILLDDEMNPKISDFSLAKMVAIKTKEGYTNRIVGTYGYMFPEYVMYGQYSEKSDIFSFGVIALKIINGKTNTRDRSPSQYAESLLSYSWKKWKEEKLLEILDSNIKEFGSYNEVIRCIQIGLLCVQENPEIRPTIAEVVSYLSNDSIQLPLPQEPAFFLHSGMGTCTIGRKESARLHY